MFWCKSYHVEQTVLGKYAVLGEEPKIGTQVIRVFDTEQEAGEFKEKLEHHSLGRLPAGYRPHTPEPTQSSIF